jgi:hypothetical protein
MVDCLKGVLLVSAIITSDGSGLPIGPKKKASWVVVNATSPLVGFGELNDNTIKGLTSLLSVEQED